MWIFLELLPDLFIGLMEIKKNAKNPWSFFICLFWLTVILIAACYFRNFHAAFILCLLSVLHLLFFIQYFYNSKKIQSINIDNVRLTEGKEVFTTTYSDLWKTSNEKTAPLRCKKNPNITIKKPKVGQPLALIINNKLITCDEISDLRILFLWIVFEKNISNDLDENWLVQVRLWGIFKPRIILYISKI